MTGWTPVPPSSNTWTSPNVESNTWTDVNYNNNTWSVNQSFYVDLGYWFIGYVVDGSEWSLSNGDSNVWTTQG
jgi:hypothetical protein